MARSGYPTALKQGAFAKVEGYYRFLIIDNCFYLLNLAYEQLTVCLGDKQGRGSADSKFLGLGPYRFLTQLDQQRSGGHLLAGSPDFDISGTHIHLRELPHVGQYLRGLITL
jgi:hypothetical protein